MAYTWRRLPDVPFAARDGMMSLVTDFGAGGTAKPHTFGGWNNRDIVNFTNDRVNEVWRADDIERGQWTQRRRVSQWSPRHWFGVATDASDVVHVYGSDPQPGRYVNDHWSALGGPSSWKLEQDNIPWGDRIFGISAFFGGKVLYIGGQSFPDLIGPPTGAGVVRYTDIWGFDPANPSAGWSQLLANCPALPRGIVDRAVVHGGELYLYSGGGYGDTAHDRQVWRTVGGDITNWTEVNASAPWQGRNYANALSWDSKLWLMFGYGGPDGGVQDNLADVWNSADGVTWTQVTGDGPPARHAATAFVWNNSIIVMCGSSVANDGNPVSDVWQLRNV